MYRLLVFSFKHIISFKSPNLTDEESGVNIYSYILYNL